MSESRETTLDQTPGSSLKSEERLRFLAEAGEILSTSLDYETALQRVARLMVPTLADWCIVDVLVADGRLHRLAVVHRDPSRAELAAELQRRYSILSPDRPHRAWDVIHGGPPWFDPDVAETRFVAEARDPEHLALLRRLGFAAEMVLPLIARGRALGVMTLVLADDNRRYGSDDLELAEELARRAALAIDNARLYAEAQAAEARYRGLFEQVADAILISDAAGRFQDVNAAALDLLGFEREEIIGARLADLVAPGSDRTAAEILSHSASGDWRGELSVKRQDGTVIPVEARTTAVDLPIGPASISVLRDISERHRAEVDRQRLAAIVKSSDDVIIDKTLDGIVTSWNPAAERMYGYTAEEMVGQSISRIFPPEQIETLGEYLERLSRGERISPHDVVRVVRGGERIDVSVSMSPIADATGRLVGAATIAQDISERKRLEAMQSDVLAMVSHDLRTPLTVIRAAAQLLQRRGEYRESTVGMILANTDRMARLIDDLADVVRLEEGHLPLQREPVDLVALVHEAAEAMREQSARHTIRVDEPDSAVIGWWDRIRLSQVLENLLGNAVKHASEGGDIVVRIEERPAEALVSVRDTGPGIAPEHQPHLFERFYQANKSRTSGLGLGLHISRILVEAHGGRISVDSRLGHGSTFTVALPLGSESTS